MLLWLAVGRTERLAAPLARQVDPHLIIAPGIRARRLALYLCPVACVICDQAIAVCPERSAPPGLDMALHGQIGIYLCRRACVQMLPLAQ